MGSFITKESFLNDALPAFLLGKKRLAVLLSSYNSVGWEDNGEKTTGKPGLRIFIQNGYVSYSPRVEGALLASVFRGPFDPVVLDLGHRASQIMEE